MNDISNSISSLKVSIASALMGGEDPANLDNTPSLLTALGNITGTDQKKLDACIEAIGNRKSFAGTNRKVVLARAQRYLTGLAIELADTDEPPRQVTRNSARPVADSTVSETATASVNRELLMLKGVGPKTALRLEAFGVSTPVDILFMLPRRYEDRRYACPISDLKPGMRAMTEGTIEKVSVFGKPWKRMMQVEISDGEHRIFGMWFSSKRPNTSRFIKGQKMRMAGLVGNYRNALQMAHPSVACEGEQSNAMGRILPVYPEIPGIPGATLEKAVRSALEKIQNYVHDPVPQSLVARHQLIPLTDALRLVHMPPEDVELAELDAWVQGSSPAHRRLAYDEFLFVQLALGLRKSSECRSGAPILTSDTGLATRTADLLGFSSTTAQQRVIEEIRRDIAQASPMRRLLQGDVGSGKTMVALAAIIACAEAGYQAALMAPTEILAEQHMRTLYPILRKLGIRAALHMGNARSSARKKFIEQTANGFVQVAIGTHALISDAVTYQNLGLAIVDEQHRFGVSQRLGLQGKAQEGKAPHLLVMTATPIPRSLALTVHGDLDISVLDELPEGRTPIETIFCGNNERSTVNSHIKEALDRGDQVYVVCPIIEQSEVLDVNDAENMYQYYVEQFGQQAVGLLHGRLAPEERDAIMSRFVANQLGLLVCTTVIEVGVNVPNATLMVIEGCERFGLAQLHQLRGRVGRGNKKSICILVGAPGTMESQQRIETLTTSNDGFHIAEQDLQIRGPGELYGRRQAGLPGFRFGDLKKDLDLLLAARTDATDILAKSPHLSCERFATLGAELKRRILAGDGPIGEESG